MKKYIYLFIYFCVQAFCKSNESLVNRNFFMFFQAKTIHYLNQFILLIKSTLKLLLIFYYTQINI